MQKYEIAGSYVHGNGWLSTLTDMMRDDLFRFASAALWETVGRTGDWSYLEDEIGAYDRDHLIPAYQVVEVVCNGA